MKTFFKIFWLSFLIILSIAFFSNTAVAAGNITGWAWSENIGWISFSCRNQNTCATFNYGINKETDGRLTGWAWSEHIGWISFNETTGFPTSLSNHSPRVRADGRVIGWARALAHGGGWDGWISMSGTTGGGVPYGVAFDATTRSFRGWAWGSDDITGQEVIGWISFSSVNCEVASPPIDCPLTPYDVILNPINITPQIRSPLNQVPPVATDHCEAPGRHTFNWSFYDPGDTQSAYQLQVATNSGFNPIFIDSQRVTFETGHNNNVSFVPTNIFAWNTTYHWRVRVWDSQNATSSWSTTTSFTTQVHRPPAVSFTLTPQNPTVNQVVQFNNNTECFGPGGNPVGTANATCTWAWDFGNGLTSTLINPTTTFATSGPHTIRLTATDSAGAPRFSCTSTQVINIEAAPPVWIEIPPPIIWLREMWASAVNNAQRSWNGILSFVNGL